MKKEDAIYNIVKLLDDFFKEKNAKRISFFFWRKDKDNSYAIDVKFCYTILNGHKEIASFGEYKLYDNLNLEESFMDCSSVYELSELIKKKLIVTDPITEDYKHCGNLFNGVTFESDNWESMVDKVFKAYALDSFKSINLSSKLENMLQIKSNDFKKSKV